MPRNMKTPEERSEIVAKAHSKVRKGYRTNTGKKRTGITQEEFEIIGDTLVALKVIGGYSNTQCAAIVGLSKGQVREIASTDKFKKRVTSVKQSLPKAALNLGQVYLVEAVMAVVHVMRTEKDNALVLKAAAEMFDRFGIPKLTRTESTVDKPNSESGTETEIPSKVLDKLRSSPPEVQEQIASLHESFLEGVDRILTGGTDGEFEEAG